MDLRKLEEVFDSDQIKTDEDSLAVYGKDWTTYYEVRASAVVFPRSTEQVQKLVSWASTHQVALVPSGGRTGLSGGAVATQGELVVSFERMNRILEFNEVDKTLEVEAGVLTDEVKSFAAERSLDFPLSFGATSSSQIGGNIATNAGGANVLRYGNTRQWVMGLEVVTGAAQILQLNRGLVKNATGYDLRHLFIGSEGSLGFITKAILKLTPAPRDTQVLLISAATWDAVTDFYAKLSSSVSLLAYEVFDEPCVSHVESAGLASLPVARAPLFVLIEWEASESSMQAVEACLEEALSSGVLKEAVLAQNPQQAKDLWALRENITESISSHKPYKNDVSVRPSRVPAFVKEMNERLSRLYPGYSLLWFGHVGDGNLHLNVLRPQSLSRELFVQKCREVDKELFSCVQDFGGSISAEHGLGLSKKDFLSYSRSAEEIRLMREIKKLFDPNGILNPGKLFPSGSGESGAGASR